MLKPNTHMKEIKEMPSASPIPPLPFSLYLSLPPEGYDALVAFSGASCAKTATGHKWSQDQWHLFLLDDLKFLN